MLTKSHLWCWTNLFKFLYGLIEIKDRLDISDTNITIKLVEKIYDRQDALDWSLVEKQLQSCFFACSRGSTQSEIYSVALCERA